MSYDQVNERHKAQILYHVNKYRVTNICELNALLNLPFKALLLIYNFILIQTNSV
jgi:hypothetical protein